MYDINQALHTLEDDCMEAKARQLWTCLWLTFQTFKELAGVDTVHNTEGGGLGASLAHSLD